MIKRGVHRISQEIYHADPAPAPSLSRSIIKDLVSDCPARAFGNHPKLGGKREESSSPAMDMGVVCHSLTLEGIDKAVPVDPRDHAGKKWNVPIGWTNNSIREARDTIRSSGKIPLLIDDYHRALEIVKAAEEQLAQSELGIISLKEEGESELTYIWEEAGVWLRTRPDWVSNDRKIILDLKFTGTTANPSAFERHIEPMGYEIQSALYRRGVKAIDKTDATFLFFVVEVQPPYLACLIGLDPSYQEIGKGKVEMGIDLWRKHMLENNWPGYDRKVHYLQPKPWSLANWEERKFNSQLADQKEFPF